MGWVIVDGCLGFLTERATLSAVLSDSTGGAEWLTPGNTLTLTQENDVHVRVEHDDNWGGGTRTILVPARTLSAVIHFTEFDDANPTRLRFDVVSVGAVLPSFASVALGGDETGENVFSLDSGGGSGWIDTATGEFFVKLYVKFLNGVFSASPARLQASFRGQYDRGSGRFHVEPNEAGDEDAVAESPEENLW